MYYAVGREDTVGASTPRTNIASPVLDKESGINFALNRQLNGIVYMEEILTISSNSRWNEMNWWEIITWIADYCIGERLTACLFSSADAFASFKGLLHRASGGSQIQNSFFISSTLSAHRFSQYTVIRLCALPPHLRAQGTYSENSLERFFSERRNGPKTAARAVIGRPRFANSKYFRASSDSTLTGRLQIQW